MPGTRYAAYRPLLVIAIFFFAVALLVRPWGNYPVNDDWQYARVAKHLAETGQVAIDVPIAPSLVAQAYLAAAFIKIFGFSHTLLRLITMVLAVALLWVLDSILRTVGARRVDRLLACALLVFNPIFLHLACSFMTEIYGYLLVLLAVWVWFSHRKRWGDPPGAPIASLGVCVTVAALAGTSFWVRQFCIIVFPALVGASLWVRVLRRDWAGIGRSLGRLMLSSLCVVGFVSTYFSWAEASGNSRPEFTGRFSELLHFNGSLWTLSAFEAVIYATALLLPFLCVAPRGGYRWQRSLILAGLMVVLSIRGKQLQPQFAGFHHHVEFPYSANIFNNSNVGPLTLSPAYWTGAGVSRWSPACVSYLEWVLLAMSLGWCYWLSISHRRDSHARELRYFSLLFGVSAFALSLQAYQNEVLDRYYFPWILSAVLLLAGAHKQRRTVPVRRWQKLQCVLAGLCLIPLAWYTVAGLHDYFRWNDARWALSRQALSYVEANNLDGGFEVNGWLNFDHQRMGDRPQHCAGNCRCEVDAFTCSDDTYQIAFVAKGAREIIAVERPNFWLNPEMSVVLTRRRQ